MNERGEGPEFFHHFFLFHSRVFTSFQFHYQNIAEFSHSKSQLLRLLCFSLTFCSVAESSHSAACKQSEKISEGNNKFHNFIFISLLLRWLLEASENVYRIHFVRLSERDAISNREQIAREFNSITFHEIYSILPIHWSTLMICTVILYRTGWSRDLLDWKWALVCLRWQWNSFLFRSFIVGCCEDYFAFYNFWRSLFLLLRIYQL